MKIQTFCMGVCATNCYVVSDDEKNCLVVDPCDLGEKIYSYIKGAGLNFSGVLITHAHFDHIYGLSSLMDEAQKDGKIGIPVYVGKDDVPAMTDNNLNLSATLFGCPYTYCEKVTPVFDGEKIRIGTLDFEVMETQGHTKGSVCFVNKDERIMFCGDTLFRFSCGRCDFDGGSAVEMRKSLKKIADLEGNYTAYSGHGEATTLDEEREGNPYIV